MKGIKNMNLPTITNVTITARRVDVVANAGYVFYDLHDYADYTDDEGNPREPLPEEISYMRARYNLPVTYDFTKIIVVPETEVPENQIFGGGNNTEIM